MTIHLKLHRGVTLIEMIAFLVILGVALMALMTVFNESVVKSVDPVVRVRALEIGQAQLDEIMARRFDENTPTGGIPACGSITGVACLGIVADTGYDDVGDYNGFAVATDPAYPLQVSVASAGADLGLPNDQARLVSVTVDMPGGSQLTLSAYRVNF